LNLSAQLGLLMLVGVLSAGFLMKALVFFRLEIAGRARSIQTAGMWRNAGRWNDFGC
jgi:hypothetical protein